MGLIVPEQKENGRIYVALTRTSGYIIRLAGTRDELPFIPLHLRKDDNSANQGPTDRSESSFQP